MCDSRNRSSTCIGAFYSNFKITAKQKRLHSKNVPYNVDSPVYSASFNVVSTLSPEKHWYFFQFAVPGLHDIQQLRNSCFTPNLLGGHMMSPPILCINYTFSFRLHCWMEIIITINWSTGSLKFVRGTTIAPWTLYSLHWHWTLVLDLIMGCGIVQHACNFYSRVFWLVDSAAAVTLWDFGLEAVRNWRSLSLMCKALNEPSVTGSQS